MKYFIPVLALFLVCAGAAGSGQPDRSGVKGLDREKISQIEKIIRDRYQWEPSEYDLEYRAEWNHDRLPLVIAIHKTKKIDWSPHFFLLPDGMLITPYSEKGFEKILEKVFTPIKSGDAEMLAELALSFALFGKPVGQLWTNPVEGRVKNGQVPREIPKPLIQFSPGGNATLEFYSYDYELLILYDCRVNIQGFKYSAEAKRLN
jgi:hypothetical protein